MSAQASDSSDVEIIRLQAEVERLSCWLERIDGGDTPCNDPTQLRQWAYEAITLHHPVEG